jgi:hypothetical protein
MSVKHREVVCLSSGNARIARDNIREYCLGKDKFLKRRLDMKFILKILVPIVLFSISACNAPFAATEEVKASETPMQENDSARPVLKTSLGDFVIVSTRFVDEVHGEKPASGEKILLVILSQPGRDQLDPATFSLEAFDKMAHDTSKGEIYILSDDGSKTISTMGGWVDDEFAMGFRLPAAAKTYILFWQDNPPIDIFPE